MSILSTDPFELIIDICSLIQIIQIKLYMIISYIRRFMILLTGYQNRTIAEIYFYKSLIMNTAAVSNQYSINIQPCIIIALELEFHVIVFTFRTQNLTVSRHREISLQVHAMPEYTIAERPESTCSSGIIFRPLIARLVWYTMAVQIRYLRL